jgi:hypothetical protein
LQCGIGLRSYGATADMGGVCLRACRAGARVGSGGGSCPEPVWRRPTLPRLEPQYHWRGGFSRPSSGWDRVWTPRYGHQAGTGQTEDRRSERRSQKSSGFWFLGLLVSGIWSSAEFDECGPSGSLLPGLVDRNPPILPSWPRMDGLEARGSRSND